MTYNTKINRLMETLKGCRTANNGFRDIEAQALSIFLPPTGRDSTCYQTRQKKLMAAHNERRASLMIYIIRRCGPMVTSVEYVSRDELLSEIQELNPLAPLEECMRRVLNPPGIRDRFDKDTKSVKPVYDIDYFRPSSQCFSGTREATRLVPTQQDDTDSDSHPSDLRNEERIRLKLFSNTEAFALWNLVECFCLTEGHANAMGRMVAEQYQRMPSVGGPEMRATESDCQWEKETIMEFVTFLWETGDFAKTFIRNMKDDDLDVGSRKEREEKKAMLKAALHVIFPLMVIDFVSTHGMNTPASRGFSNSLRRTSAKYRAVTTFAVVSSTIHQRSKMPAILGGSAFFDEEVVPCLKSFISTLRVQFYVDDLTRDNGINLEQSQRDHLDEMRKCFKAGKLPCQNLLTTLYMCALRAMPAGVDRERRQSQVKIPETRVKRGQDNAPAASDGAKRRRTTVEASSILQNDDDNSGGTGDQDQMPEMVRRLHQTLDGFTDNQDEMNCLGSVIMRMALIAGYPNMHNLRRTLTRSLAFASPDTSDSEEDVRNTIDEYPKAYTRGSAGRTPQAKSSQANSQSSYKDKQSRSESPSTESHHNRQRYQQQEQSASSNGESTDESSDQDMTLGQYQRGIEAARRRATGARALQPAYNMPSEIVRTGSSDRLHHLGGSYHRGSQHEQQQQVGTSNEDESEQSDDDNVLYRRSKESERRRRLSVLHDSSDESSA